jgi:hypothetical protein
MDTDQVSMGAGEPLEYPFFQNFVHGDGDVTGA